MSDTSIFRLATDKDGRVLAEQTIKDKDGKDSTLKGEVARIDATAWENVGNIALDVARNVAEHTEAYETHKQAAGHESKVLAALMLALRASTKRANGSVDWDGNTAAVRAGSANLQDAAVEPYFSKQLAEARGPGGTGEQIHDLLVSMRKKRESMFSQANSTLARIFYNGIGLNEGGVVGERASAVVAMFEGDGKYAAIYPANALKVLKGGLPKEVWESIEQRKSNGAKIRLRTPTEVAASARSKAEAAANRTAIKEIVGDSTPEHVADALAAAAVIHPVEVTSDNAQTIVQAWAAKVRVVSSEMRGLSEQFSGIETTEMTPSTRAIAERALTDSARVLVTISMEANALADSSAIFAGELGNSLMALAREKMEKQSEPTEAPASDPGEPDGAEVPEQTEAPEGVTPIKTRTRKSAARKARTPQPVA